MSQTTDTLLLDPQNRIHTSMHTFLHNLRDKASTLYTSSILEMLIHVEKATTASQLSTAINRVQKRIWKLPANEQTTFRNALVVILSTRTLQNKQSAMRIEAAGWLRLFVQAGFVATPQDVFVTLVTAATRISPDITATIQEQQSYLKMIFDCFWPFRYPYPAYTWQLFPANKVFYPLAAIFSTADERTQDTLISIFGELPSLNDVEIASYVLPAALQWANHADPERRKRITNILARLDTASAQEKLERLLSDADPDVREGAKSASDFLRQA
ncbi:MAG: HEAT repeat domain-containing protein [Ktedonobacteraceae bacterium]